ncbi:MAG: NUDIX domain-containing protein [Microbacterium sp.]
MSSGTIGGGMEPGDSQEDAAAHTLLEETGSMADEHIDLGATWRTSPTDGRGACALDDRQAVGMMRSVRSSAGVVLGSDT